MPSPGFTSEHRPKTLQDRGHYGRQDPTHNLSPAKPTLSYAEAAGLPPSQPQTTTTAQNPTYHIEAHDPRCSHPSKQIPHLLITGRYSASTLLPNELAFRNVFQPYHAATRELLKSCRTEAHRAVKTRMSINLFPTDTHGDTIMIVTRKANIQTGTWTLTGDIKIHFGSARAAILAYQQ